MTHHIHDGPKEGDSDMAWQCVMYERTGEMEWRDLPDGRGRIGSPYYRNVATGEVILADPDLPIGAMFYSNELYDIKRGVGPDGKCLYVVTPGGHWPVDHPSSDNGPGWTRTGEPPNVTASPSINFVGRYHGFLQNGVLTDDCEGRVFP
jgi:hypothetical protein